MLDLHHFVRGVILASELLATPGCQIFSVPRISRIQGYNGRKPFVMHLLRDGRPRGTLNNGTSWRWFKVFFNEIWSSLMSLCRRLVFWVQLAALNAIKCQRLCEVAGYYVTILSEVRASTKVDLKEMVMATALCSNNVGAVNWTDVICSIFSAPSKQTWLQTFLWQWPLSSLHVQFVPLLRGY